MKKSLSLLSSGALVFSMLLTGCSGNSDADKKEEETPTPAPAETAEPAETAAPEGSKDIVGGWQVHDSYSVQLDDHAAEIFTVAAEAAYATDQEAIQVLATQVVNGTNYAYLTYSTDAGVFGIDVVNEDAAGNVTLTTASSIDVADVSGKPNLDAKLLGGWTVTGSGKPGGTSAEAESALTGALQSYTGLSNVMPIVLLGTQVVSGTNYKFLCYGEATTADPQTSVYVITVYEDLNGNAELTDVAVLDLAAYVGATMGSSKN